MDVRITATFELKCGVCLKTATYTEIEPDAKLNWYTVGCAKVDSSHMMGPNRHAAVVCGECFVNALEVVYFVGPRILADVIGRFDDQMGDYDRAEFQFALDALTPF